MLYISPDIMIPEKEIQWEAVRSGGPGGQNVNKVSSAVHLRFDLNASGLPETVKTRISAMRDRRITKEGVIVIKAQRFRNREKNRQDAVERLRTIIQGALQPPKKEGPPAPPVPQNKTGWTANQNGAA